MVNVDQDTKSSSKDVSIRPDANVSPPFLPINESWQSEKCHLFEIELYDVHHIISAEKAEKSSLT